MTSISIFLIWPDSILNKLEPLSYTAVHKSELRDDSVWTPHTTQTQMTLMFPKALSHGGWESLGRVGHGQKEELHLLLQNKLPASAGPCFSHLLFTPPYLAFCWSPLPGFILQGRPPPWAFSTTKPSGHGVHLPSSSSLTILWDGMQNGGALEILEASWVWPLGCWPLQSLILEYTTLSNLVPEPALALISLQSFCSPATYDPVFYFSNLSGSSHHVKQRSDLAWKDAVNCFL